MHAPDDQLSRIRLKPLRITCRMLVPTRSGNKAQQPRRRANTDNLLHGRRTRRVGCARVLFLLVGRAHTLFCFILCCTMNGSVTAGMDGKVVIWDLRLGTHSKCKTPKKVRHGPDAKTEKSTGARVRPRRLAFLAIPLHREEVLPCYISTG